VLWAAQKTQRAENTHHLRPRAHATTLDRDRIRAQKENAAPSAGAALWVCIGTLARNAKHYELYWQMCVQAEKEDASRGLGIRSTFTRHTRKGPPFPVRTQAV